GEIPPFACFGSPHLIEEHMTLPSGGEAGNGFRCRARLFRVLVTKPEKNERDQRQNIANSCAELRFQTWGEKYPDINQKYQAWCRSKPELKNQGYCLPPGSAGAQGGAPKLPYMLLSREELLFFYGHQELYCRADREGLIHFLDPVQKKWADTFTCGIARGVLESGPFEEGVQACAIAPFVGAEVTGIEP